MQRYLVIPAMVIGITLICTSESTIAQQGLFGQRTLGGSLSRRAGPQATAATGTIDQNRRFLRDQRSPTEMVGVAPGGGGAAGFVGGQSAVTSAVSSVIGLQEEVRAPLNRPRILRPTGLYPERLSIPSATADGIRQQTDAETLSEALRSIMASRRLTIEVSPEDRSATLRGAVPSADDRTKIELLVMLEPGIQKVVNDLTVDPALPSQPIRRSRLQMDQIPSR